MRVNALTAGFLLTTALISVAGLAMIRPAMAGERPAGERPAGERPAGERKVTCLCNCPDDYKAHRTAVRTPRMTRKVVRPAARARHYDYASAAPVARREWHGAWRVAPNDAMIGPMPGPCCAPGPQAYYAPPPPPPEYGIRVDDRGWTGGVGNMGEGGGGGGGGGDYGQLHLAQGGNQQNGPTYNDYNQSFQYNPSQAGPFRARLMGGYAPPPASK